MCCPFPLLLQQNESVVVSSVFDQNTIEQQPQTQFHKRLLTTNNDTNNNDSTSTSRKRRRIVQFSSSTQQEVQLSSSFYVIDEEVKSAGWYNKSELDEMRFEARDVCRQVRNEDMISSSNCSNDNEIQLKQQKVRPLLSFNEETRGLEYRICIERQRCKYLVGQFVLTAASKLKLNQPKHIAKLAWASSRVTRYATKIAIEEASRDYICVYQQSLKKCFKL